MADLRTFDWGELGEQWWRDAASTAGATDIQTKFACAKQRGCSNTAAAREAGYADEGDGIRQAGYRAFRTTAVQNLLALAAAEAKGSTDGTVDSAEAKRILSKLARGSDPSVKIRAIEGLEKIAAREAEISREQNKFNAVAQLTAFAQRSTLCAILAHEFATVHGVEFETTAALKGPALDDFLAKQSAVTAALGTALG